MKTSSRKHFVLLAFSLLIGLFLPCFLWIRAQQHQYTINRELIEALKIDDTSQAMALVEAGADPNTHYEPAPAPSLFLLMQQWLDHKALPVDKSPTAFLLACGMGWDGILQSDEVYSFRLSSEPLVLAMIAHNADVNPDTGEESVLCVAIGLNRVRVVERLLEHGANADTTDGHGLSPLMWAALYGNPGLVDPLLKHGAQINRQEKDGWTALHYAVHFNTRKDMAAQLLKHKADPNIPSKQGVTALMLAQQQYRPDLVGLLRHSRK